MGSACLETRSLGKRMGQAPVGTAHRFMSAMGQRAVDCALLGLSVRTVRVSEVGGAETGNC
jgi:hypothetical protein